MNPIDVIELALQAHRHRHDALTAQLHAARQEGLRAAQQLEQLQHYARERSEQMTQTGRACASPTWQTLAPFQAKMELAMSYQQQTVERHRSAVQAMDQQVADTGRRIAVLEAALADEHARGRQRVARREQREADQAAGLRHGPTGAWLAPGNA